MLRGNPVPNLLLKTAVNEPLSREFQEIKLTERETPWYPVQKGCDTVVFCNLMDAAAALRLGYAGEAKILGTR